MKSIVFGIILAHSAQVAQLNDERLWTFVGYLKPANGCQSILAGCLPDGTHFFQIPFLKWVECQRLVEQAKTAGGNGGACI